MLLLSGTSLTALARPWVGVAAAYVIVVLIPQDVWYWHFDGVRPAFWITLSTLAGFALAAFGGALKFDAMKSRRNLYLFLLWVFFTLSYYAGPYANVDSELRVTESDWAIEQVHKIFLLYFLACVCIDSQKKLKALAYVIVVSVIFFVYWANNMYLTGQSMGRLGGPVGPSGGGVYADQNNFAMIFVVGLPFLWYLGFAVKHRLLRWSLWLIIPFGWHAVFLTASRGGLLGLAATLGLTVLRSKQKMFGILLVPAFVVAYMWQAGDLMQERANTLSSYETEGSAVGRLEAWETASRMIADHPITGVGIASFVPAFPDYSEHEPREAHNTFFQISAESGLIAGIMYVLVVAACLLGLWRNGSRLRKTGTGNPEIYWINEATLVGFFGLAVVSLFLSMQIIEIFYYMCVLTNALLYVSAFKEQPEKSSNQVRNESIEQSLSMGSVLRKHKVRGS